MPALMIGVVLEADTNRLPCEDRDDERTNYYLGARERKSNEWDSGGERGLVGHAHLFGVCFRFLLDALIFLVNQAAKFGAELHRWVANFRGASFEFGN